MHKQPGKQLVEWLADEGGIIRSGARAPMIGGSSQYSEVQRLRAESDQDSMHSLR